MNVGFPIAAVVRDLTRLLLDIEGSGGEGERERGTDSHRAMQHRRNVTERMHDAKRSAGSKTLDLPFGRSLWRLIALE